MNTKLKIQNPQRVYIRVFIPEQTRTSLSFLFFLFFFLFLFLSLLSISLLDLPLPHKVRRRSALLRSAHIIADPPQPGPIVGRLRAAQNACTPHAQRTSAHAPARLARARSTSPKSARARLDPRRTPTRRSSGPGHAQATHRRAPGATQGRRWPPPAWPTPISLVGPPTNSNSLQINSDLSQSSLSVGDQISSNPCHSSLSFSSSGQPGLSYHYVAANLSNT